ncbi:MAG: hypothetical protein K2M46_12400 [Lachnospiraceae bacterium]|nr:hypothetical protein [Lachnospiraceae bacterium]
MKISKKISAISLLSLTLLLGLNHNIQASSIDKSAEAVEEEQNLVSFGSFGDIDIRMESSDLESLEEGERQRLLSYIVQIITEENEADFQNGISTYATTGKKVIETPHTCSPTGPYLPDKYYRVAYFYNQDTGKLLGKMDFYICGHVGTKCNYLASITTIY